LKRNNKRLHISFDVDSICPNYLSATGTTAPFGLIPREVFYILRKAA
jgi:arginase family enzyme